MISTGYLSTEKLFSLVREYQMFHVCRRPSIPLVSTKNIKIALTNWFVSVLIFFEVKRYLQALKKPWVDIEFPQANNSIFCLETKLMSWGRIEIRLTATQISTGGLLTQLTSWHRKALKALSLVVIKITSSAQAFRLLVKGSLWRLRWTSFHQQSLSTFDLFRWLFFCVAHWLSLNAHESAFGFCCQARTRWEARRNY
jgi:hypothetical protein